MEQDPQPVLLNNKVFSKKEMVIAIMITILIAIISFLVVPYFVTQKSGWWTYNNNTAAIGDTIGGVVGAIMGFVGAILTFLAFFIQYKANQIQITTLNEQRLASVKTDRQNKIQQIENNFFELLKIHRENVNEMDYRNSRGRNVIVKILNEFYKVLKQVQAAKFVNEHKLADQDVANIAYLILFFGVDETVEDTLENRLFQHYGKQITSNVLELVKVLRNTTTGNTDDRYYFNGHQSRLGHYYRHFFRSVKFIHEDDVLNPKEKATYIKLLQTQLSTHEQILFFFNSISDLGLPWELGNNVKEEDKLISKYHLIRNVPLGFLYGYNPKKFYPKLELENDFEVGP